MDAAQFMQAIGSLGFPIVACCALFYYLNQEKDAHKEEMRLMTEALNKNTDILTELKTIISMLTRGRKNDADSSSKNLQ